MNAEPNLGLVNTLVHSLVMTIVGLGIAMELGAVALGRAGGLNAGFQAVSRRIGTLTGGGFILAVFCYLDGVVYAADRVRLH